MSLIMGQVIPDQLVLSVLEVEKLNFSNLFGIYLHYSPVLLNTQVSNIGPSWFSCFKIGSYVEKEKNADKYHFLLFPQCFLPYDIQIEFFALLSPTCSRGAFRAVQCPSSVMNCQQFL